jgi:hypothetical protein
MAAGTMVGDPGDVPRCQDRFADFLAERFQLIHHRVEVIGVHPGRGAGQPVT